MKPPLFVTADDLAEINAALARGNDVQIKTTSNGVRIAEITVKTIKKKTQISV